MAAEESGQCNCYAWGAASQPRQRETVSGDAFLMREVKAGLLVAVIDGLGHGPAAAEVADRAVAFLASTVELDLAAILRQCHRALTGSRGLALSVALLQPAGDRLEWCAVGDVAGAILRPDAQQKSQALFGRPGVVGFQLPPLRVHELTFGPGAVLIVSTDGVQPQVAKAANPQQDPVRIASHLVGLGSDGRDDSLVVAVKHVA